MSGPGEEPVEKKARVQPSTALLQNPASQHEIDKEARMKKAIEMRVSRANEDEDSDIEDKDTRFL